MTQIQAARVVGCSHSLVNYAIHGWAYQQRARRAAAAAAAAITERAVG